MDPYLTHSFSRNAELRPFGHLPFRDDGYMSEMTVGRSLEISVEALEYHINSKECYNFFWQGTMPCSMWDLSSPTRDLQWKRGVLNTGPPGKSQECYNFS